jgi:hypothetical protein
MKRKAQHEIVGFILIVVIVVIIGLFLLVFYLRQEPVESESLKVQNFLHSSRLYTTECIVSVEPLNTQDLTESCLENKKCLDDRMACEVLENTMTELVHESWLVAETKPVKAYFFNIFYKEDESEEEKILSLQEGNCTGSKTGAERFSQHGSGKIFTTMEICYT